MSYIAPSPIEIAAVAVRIAKNHGLDIGHTGDSYAIFSLGRRDGFKFYDCVAKHYFPKNGSITGNNLTIEEAYQKNLSLFSLEELLRGYYSTASLSEEAWAMKRSGGTAMLYIPCKNNCRLAIAWNATNRKGEFALDMCKLLGEAISECNTDDEILRAQVKNIIINGVDIHYAENTFS